MARDVARDWMWSEACEMLAREHDAIVEGQVGKVSEVMLDCRDHKFVVKTLDFRPQRK